MVNILRASLLCMALVSSVSLFASCPAPKPDKLAELDRYTAVRFNVPEAQRTADAQANDQCFWKVDYTLLPSKRPVSLYLSPDGKYATPVLFDLSVDLVKERAEKQEAAKQMLVAGSGSGPKGKAKPITMVIFSDYECPFCQRLEAYLQEPSVLERLKDVDVQLRNYPLSMHPWAKQAAIAAACVHRQNPASDADYAKNVFSAQRGIHPNNVDTRIHDIAMATPGVDKELLSRCISNQESAPDVEADLKLGRLVGVEGTPTVFINGVRQLPFRTSDELVAAVAGAQTTASK